METVLRPGTLHAHSEAYEETNDMIFSENGEELYNNQIFLRWGNNGPVGPPSMYSTGYGEYVDPVYLRNENYNGHIENVDNAILMNEQANMSSNEIYNINDGSIMQNSLPLSTNQIHEINVIPRNINPDVVLQSNQINVTPEANRCCCSIS